MPGIQRGLRNRGAVPCHAPTRVFCLYLHFGKDRGCSGHSGNVTTHGPLLDSSSRNSLWEEEEEWGATLPAPKSAHSWEEEMLSQLRDRIQDLIP